MIPDKRGLRTQFRTLRDSLDPADHADKSKAICTGIARFAVSRKIRRLGAFWPLGSEIDLRPLIHTHPDWLFFFPKVTSTEPPRLAWGPEPLEPGPWGLLEPTHAQHFLPPVQLLLVPGLAFDPDGYRLGYGKGFYDALLAKLEERILTLAVGFDCQRTAMLPRNPMDMPVQGLITESGLTWFTA